MAKGSRWWFAVADKDRRRHEATAPPDTVRDNKKEDTMQKLLAMLLGFVAGAPALMSGIVEAGVRLMDQRDHRPGRLEPLWHGLLRRPASKLGRLCSGDGPHGRGDRRRRPFMPTTPSAARAEQGGAAVTISIHTANMVPVLVVLALLALAGRAEAACHPEGAERACTTPNGDPGTQECRLQTGGIKWSACLPDDPFPLHRRSTCRDPTWWCSSPRACRPAWRRRSHSCCGRS